MRKRLPLIGERIANNWLYKIVALLVAITIWVTTIHGRKDAMILQNIDLEFELRPGYVVTDVDARAVTVKVAGPRNVLKKMRQTRQHVSLDLTQVQSGRRMVDINASDISLPVGVRLVSLTPKQVELQISEVRDGELQDQGLTEDFGKKGAR